MELVIRRYSGFEVRYSIFLLLLPIYTYIFIHYDAQVVTIGKPDS